MKRYSWILPVALLFFCSLNAQELKKNNPRLYEVWISLNSDQERLNGLLYEIGDSSIIITDIFSSENILSGVHQTTVADYRNVNRIKIHRVKNVQRGMLLGGATGPITGIAFALSSLEEVIDFSGLEEAIATSFILGISGAMMTGIGLGVGALIGIQKDRMAIRGSYQNFNTFKNTLAQYSYVKEPWTKRKYFEHKAFAGFRIGPSILTGDYHETGFGGGIFGGYRFTKNLGISLSWFENDFDITETDQSDYWAIGGITVNPLISFHLADNIIVDLKPGIGFTGKTLYVGEEEKKNGNSFCYDLNAAMTWTFSKRWGFCLDADYLSTDQKFGDNSTTAFRTYSINAGFIYKFSRRGL